MKQKIKNIRRFVLHSRQLAEGCVHCMGLLTNALHKTNQQSVLSVEGKSFQSFLNHLDDEKFFNNMAALFNLFKTIQYKEHPEEVRQMQEQVKKELENEQNN